MSLPPQKIVYVSPEFRETASGYSKLLGKEGRDLYWDVADPADLDDIFDRSGGSASSVFGGIRCQDFKPRSTSVPSWSDYTAYIHQPIQGEWRIGTLRYNVMVRVRRMTVSSTLA